MGNPLLHHGPVQNIYPGRGGMCFKVKLQQCDDLGDGHRGPVRQ